MADLSRRTRLRGVLARILGRMPGRVQVRLSKRPPIQIDGQTLDPTLQLFLSMRRKGEQRPLTAGTPEQARARHRAQMLAIRGRSTRIGGTRDLSIPGPGGMLRARHYTPSGVAGEDQLAGLLVYFHGGGYTIGDLDTHDEACRLLCRYSGHSVLSVEYRLAPEHPFPAALEDAEAAFRWAQAHARELGVDRSTISVGGDSAGGNLAAVVAQRTARQHPARAQLLIYPPVDRTSRTPSSKLFGDLFLTTADRDTFSKYYYGEVPADASDPSISPLLEDRLSGLPPTLIITAGFDVLRDEGEAYAAALNAAGTRCELHREPSLAHGFIQMTGASPACRKATVQLARRWRSFFDATSER